MNYASLFTGGGLADQGARMAGLHPVWGVEYDPAIAAVAQQNDKTGKVITASVCDVDYSALPRVDVLHLSPPCPSFSVAKTGRGETELDRDLARACVRAIEAQRPRLVTIENVRAYAQSESLQIIMAALGDYHVTSVILNAADHGVPQTRERLFVIAHSGGWMQASRALPAETAWQGWYAAIEDILHTLPASQFAPWQLPLLPEEIRSSGVLIHPTEMRHPSHRFNDEPCFTIVAGSGNITRGPFAPRAFIMPNTTESDVRYNDEPAHTTTASDWKNMRRAFLVSGDNASRTPTVVGAEAPSFTIGASAQKAAHRAWLSQGRVVSMTPRALARFQSVPDTYALPESKSLACRIIGNGVACELYRRLLVSQLDLSRRSREAESARRAKASGATINEQGTL